MRYCDTVEVDLKVRDIVIADKKAVLSLECLDLTDIESSFVGHVQLRRHWNSLYTLVLSLILCPMI